MAKAERQRARHYELKAKISELVQQLSDLSITLGITFDRKARAEVLKGLDQDFLESLGELTTLATSVTRKVKYPDRTPVVNVIYTHRGRDGYSYFLEQFPSKKYAEGNFRWCRIKHGQRGDQRERLGRDTLATRQKYGLDKIANLPVLTPSDSPDSEDIHDAFFQAAQANPLQSPWKNERGLFGTKWDQSQPSAAAATPASDLE